MQFHPTGLVPSGILMTEACPKGVDPAFAIQLFKRHMVLTAWGLGWKKSVSKEMPPMSANPKPGIPPAPEPTVKGKGV